MKLRYTLPLILLLAMVSAIYAKANLFRNASHHPGTGIAYVSMSYPARLDGVKLFDVNNGEYVEANLNADNLWEIRVDPEHRYQVEVLYNSKQGSFQSLSFGGATKIIGSINGPQWYRITNEPIHFSNGSSYILYSCQGTNCFD